ncbi:NmrA-like family-domain-containing protein [Mycena leptocephala]|nr:NmrA-like family-domain-containing protein [Mycena leptocephala]
MQLVTNFWEHVDMDREVAEGKLLIDAAKAGGVSGIVWSGLPSATKLSGGKYPHVWHFDGKAAVTEYGRQAGVPFVDVQAGAYGSNYFTPPFAPAKQADGSFLLARPVKPTTAMPFIDAEHDYGIFLWREYHYGGSDGTVVGSHREEDCVPADPRGNVRQDLQSAGLPLHIVLDLTEVLLVFDEFGWKGNGIPQDLVRRPRTWTEYAKITDWSKVLV